MPPRATATIASTISDAASRASVREGRYSNPIAGADRIHDLLPVRARRLRVAHQPVPDLRIGLIQQFVECGQRGFIRLRTMHVQPSPQPRIQFARAAPAAPAQTFAEWFRTCGDAHARAVCRSVVRASSYLRTAQNAKRSPASNR